MPLKYVSPYRQRVRLTLNFGCARFLKLPYLCPPFFTHCRPHLIEGGVGWGKKCTCMSIRVCDTSSLTCDFTHTHTCKMHSNAKTNLAKETLQQDDNTKAVECEPNTRAWGGQWFTRSHKSWGTSHFGPTMFPNLRVPGIQASSLH